MTAQKKVSTTARSRKVAAPADLQPVLDKGISLQAKQRPRIRIEGDYTVININALSHDYKLSKVYTRVRNLEFRGKEKIQLQTFRDYLAHVVVTPVSLVTEQKPRPQYPADEAYRNTRLPFLYPKGLLLILVNANIYGAIAPRLNQYVLDVGRDGYWATVYTVQGGTPAEIRAFIRSQNPVGALLVGSIAAPWYEHANDFHGSAEFPCDLYYMDTNGTWSDPDNDGKFDGHSGNLDPEIWIGRLWTPTNNGNDTALLNDYLARNHKFRLGQLGHAQSALAFVDDDWQGFGDCDLSQMFSPAAITAVNDPVQTDADLYKAEVNALRSWVQLCAHSWPQGHALWVQNANEYIETPYFRDVNPPNAHFYNLFCCGPGLYTSADYLAGWYIFDKSGGGSSLGLAAIASAKSGSMLMFADFYRPLGQGKVIGDAFVDWWKARGPDHDDGEQSWFYGLTLLGDPTLSWWKGAVPQPQEPQNGDVFDHWPRNMRLRWDPVNLPGVKYTVEIDYFTGKWAEESGQSTYVYHNITQTTLDHVFVGAQRGRWRVRAKVGNTFCSWSPWSYFRFTV